MSSRGDPFQVCGSHYSVSSLRQGPGTGTSPGASALSGAEWTHSREGREQTEVCGREWEVWEDDCGPPPTRLIGYSLRIWPWKGDGVRPTDELQL